MLCLAFLLAAVTLSPNNIEVHGGQKLESVSYKGREAIHFPEQGQELGLVKGTDFHDGTIEIDIAASTLKTAAPDARGFAGISFRASDAAHYETFYLRPTNGRADDQLRRNHSVQYISQPGWPWERLRSETPGVYESYADLVPGEWTHVKIVVKGVRAELYVGSAEQPVLIVKDLKQGDTHGALGLWIGPGTDAYFANLKIEKKN